MVRLPDFLECQGLSLNLISKRVMSLILEKYVVVIEYFPVSFKILEYFKIAHLKIIDYTEHSTIKNKQCK